MTADTWPPSPTWTTRCAAMLWGELVALNAERFATTIDGGWGAMAMAAIRAFPPGPRRDYEIATWVRRFVARDPDDAIVTYIVRDDATDDEINILAELSAGLERHGWVQP